MSRTRLKRFSMRLVEDSTRVRLSGRSRRIMVSVSSSPSRSEAAAPGYSRSNVRARLSEKLARAFWVSRGVGLAQGAAGLCAQPLGQGFGNVAFLVFAAALDQCARAKGIGDRFAQRLGAVDDEQQRAVRGQSARNQVGQQLLAGCGVLARPFAQSQHVFLTV